MEYRHAMILQNFKAAGATVEDLARAWASMDGKRDAFDDENGKPLDLCPTGHFHGYVVETEEILRRAIGYAMARKAAHT